MEQIILPQVVESVITPDKSSFVIAPLFPGYGNTVGNSIRRALLSSLPGSAISSIKIDGVEHEFSTVKGMREDVVELILNLKQVKIYLHDTSEPVVIRLEAKGPGVVKAGNFKENSKVSIANPDHYLCTLSEKSSLVLEATIEYGRGYDAVEKREGKNTEIGRIAIDALYSPVVAVGLNVENTRVGKMTNYDKLTLTVSTNGTIAPKDALKFASAILVDQFHLLATYDQISSTDTVATSEAGVGTENIKIEDLFNAKAVKILAENNITSLDDIKNASQEAIDALSGLTQKALTEINKIRA
jgi:DNA-directed RNA polymerase subunit alpha